MKRSLYQGDSTIYLQHLSTGGNVSVIAVESELANSTAIIRFSVAPVAETFQEEPLQSVAIDEASIIDGFVAHLQSSDIEMSDYQLELLSADQTITFSVSPALTTHGDLRTLYFTVNNT